MRFAFLLCRFPLRQRTQSDVDLRQRVGDGRLCLAVQLLLSICGGELFPGPSKLAHVLFLLGGGQSSRLQYETLRALGETGQFTHETVAKLWCMRPQQKASGASQGANSFGRERRQRGRNSRSGLPLH